MGLIFVVAMHRFLSLALGFGGCCGFGFSGLVVGIVFSDDGLWFWWFALRVLWFVCDFVAVGGCGLLWVRFLVCYL